MVLNAMFLCLLLLILSTDLPTDQFSCVTAAFLTPAIDQRGWRRRHQLSSVRYSFELKYSSSRQQPPLSNKNNNFNDTTTTTSSKALMYNDTTTFSKSTSSQLFQRHKAFYNSPTPPPIVEAEEDEMDGFDVADRRHLKVGKLKMTHYRAGKNNNGKSYQSSSPSSEKINLLEGLVAQQQQPEQQQKRQQQQQQDSNNKRQNRNNKHGDDDDDKTTTTPVAMTMGTLGDIMSREQRQLTTFNNDTTRTQEQQLSKNTTTTASAGLSQGLVTTTVPSGSLASRFGITHPLDRMALTANGNLQRLVSSYYDAPVQVLVDYCKLQQPPPYIYNEIDEDKRRRSTSTSMSQRQNHCHPKTWDRFVRLRVHNQTFGTAHSIITVHDPTCQQLVESGTVGLGQLFRYLDILPEFELHQAGPICERGGFWRDYSLHCPEMVCQIHEEFGDIWNIVPPEEL